MKDGQKSVSVPLDVPLSLQTLREVLDKSQYTCRALHHSRKLLILYLAGQQNSESSSSKGNCNVMLTFYFVCTITVIESDSHIGYIQGFFACHKICKNGENM